jgi:hypothetical protein
VSRTGRPEEAVQLARAALVQAERSESPWFLCVIHLTLGRLLSQSNPEDELAVESHLVASLGYAEAMQSRPLYGRALLALGELHYRQQRKARGPKAKASGAGGKRQARESLTRAANLLGTLGMQAEQEQALALLAQLDAQPTEKRRGKR